MPRNTRRQSTSRDRRAGAVFVEFALGFIIFIMLVFGVLEGARLVWTYAALSHGAREGARYAMVHGHQNPVTDTALATWVKDRLVAVDKTNVTVTSTWEDAAKSGSSVVAVQVDYPIPLIAAPLVFGRSSIDLTYVARATVAE